MELKFRKKPVVIEAFQMTEERRTNNADWPNWLHEAWMLDREAPGSLYPTEEGAGGDGRLSIGTLEGQHLVSWGDWIIQGVHGELYPCKPDIFAKTYEPVESSPASAPKGFALVPVVPTHAILDVMFNAGIDRHDGDLTLLYRAILSAAPTLSVSEWIDVSKQLPSHGDDVLCALTDGCVRVLEFNTHPEKRFIDRDTGKWWWIAVGHWMPLPKAPARSIR